MSSDKDREDARRAAEQRREERRAMRGDPRAQQPNEMQRREQEQHTRGDQDWKSGIEDILGATPRELRKEYGGSSAEDKAARDALKWVNSAYTKDGKRKRAKKVKPVIDKARKAKAKKGCLGALAVLAGSATAAGYGLWEAASAVLGWS